MKTQNVILAGAAVAAVLSGASADHGTLCSKLAKTEEDQLATVKALVDGVVGKIADNAGANDGNGAEPRAVSRFFDGSIPGTKNFLSGGEGTNAGDLNTLVEHLYGYFDEELGCDLTPTRKYEGIRDQNYAHAHLQIDAAGFNGFITYAAQTLTELGVPSDDIAIAGGWLQTFGRGAAIATNEICSLPECPEANVPAALEGSQTFCAKYTRALFEGTYNSTNAVGLISAVVDGTVAAALDSPLVEFFNGEHTPEIQDFTADPAAYATLRAHLIAFFGRDLGCNFVDFPRYNGRTNQALVHEPMKITKAVFEAFNGALAGVASSAGVAQSDLVVVGGYLASFGRGTGPNAICNQPDCDSVEGFSGAASLTASAATVALLAVGAVAALL